jgi:hypothetical protein
MARGNARAIGTSLQGLTLNLAEEEVSLPLAAVRAWHSALTVN